MAHPILRPALVAAIVLCAVAQMFTHLSMPVTEAATGSWTGNYFNNTTLSGSAVLTRNDAGGTLPSTSPTIDFFWPGSPGPGVNADGWSARWTRSDTYAAGTYRFTITGDDGIRLFVDNTLVVNGW